MRLRADRWVLMTVGRRAGRLVGRSVGLKDGRRAVRSGTVTVGLRADLWDPMRVGRWVVD